MVRSPVWLLLLVAGFFDPVSLKASCPPPEETLALLSKVDFDNSARVTRFGAESSPEGMVEAIREPGKILVTRDGKTGHAVALVEVPVEHLWKAVNDEDHHAGFLVDVSVVVGGTPRGPSRLLLQAVRRLGVGRFWVDRVEMSGELYTRSNGRLWELTWRDAFEEVDLDRPPIVDVAEDHRRVEWTRGAWLFVPLASDCTWVDYYVESDPGGALSAFQALGAKQAMRDAVEGLVRMAEEHVPEPHSEARFVRPDGEVLP